MKTWSFFILLVIGVSALNIVRGDVAAPTDLRNLPARGAAQGNPLDPDPHSQRSFDVENDPGESGGVAPPAAAPGHSKIWNNSMFPTDTDSNGSLIGSAMRIYLDLVLWHMGVQRTFLVGDGASVSGDPLRAERVNVGIARARSGQRTWAQGSSRIENGRR